MLLASTGAVLQLGGCACDEDPSITRLRPDIRIYDPRASETDAVDSLDFGEVPLGASVTLALGVTNTGSDILRICLEGHTAGDCQDTTRLQPEEGPFQVEFENKADNNTWVLDPRANREVEVTFTPVEEGPISVSLILTHNTLQRSTTILLSGRGVAPRIDLSARVLDFGQVTVHQYRELDLVLTNGTRFNQPVRIEPLMQPAIIFGVSDAAGTVVPHDQTFRADVPGSGSLTIKVWFQPADELAYSNTLRLSYCPTCDEAVELLGQGVKPAFELVPAEIDFGTVEQGTAAAESFVVRNIGNVPLTVYSVALESGTTTEFNPTPQGQLPAELQPQEVLRVDVSYRGTSPGDDVGRIEVATNAWDDPATPVSETTGYVSLRATSRGPKINPFPRAVNFGTVSINGRSQRPLALQNTGNAPLVISRLELRSTTNEITLDGVPNLPITVEPGLSVDLTLRYGPLDAGPDTADVFVESNDRDDGTLFVPVNGIGGVPTTCSVNVAPAQVTFGLVERGRVATLPVEIRNGGAQPCSISNLRLNGAAEFRMTTGALTNFVVGAGQSQRVSVQYAPTAYGVHNTLLEFDADDPSQAQVQVPISGASEQSQILVIPSSVDFNVVPVTCRSPVRTVTIYNTGNSSVQITSVYLDPTTTPEFELMAFSTPRALPAGGQAELTLRYRPADIGADTGLLFIAHSASAFPVAVPLSGEGQISPTVTDTFSQLPAPQADVLFIVDNSCSMSEEQASLGSNLGVFLTYARQQNIDFHIAVTTTDIRANGQTGRFVSGARGALNGTPRILTPQTPNVDALFAQFVNQGTNGDGIERGLEAAYLALSDPLINTHNAGFLRQDAALAIIFVSDEEDQSNRTVSFYENFYRNLKGFQNSSMFSASSIVGTQSPRCSGPGGNADYGPRYIQVAQNTGGVVESICSANWGQTLANIALNSFGLRRQFQLSSQPVAVTIAVRVNGQAVPSTSPGGQMNWSYDPATNTITFTQSATPQAGATISVTYSVACLP